MDIVEINDWRPSRKNPENFQVRYLMKGRENGREKRLRGWGEVGDVYQDCSDEDGINLVIKYVRMIPLKDGPGRLMETVAKLAKMQVQDLFENYKSLQNNEDESSDEEEVRECTMNHDENATFVSVDIPFYFGKLRKWHDSMCRQCKISIGTTKKAETMVKPSMREPVYVCEQYSLGTYNVQSNPTRNDLTN